MLHSCPLWWHGEASLSISPTTEKSLFFPSFRNPTNPKTNPQTLDPLIVAIEAWLCQKMVASTCVKGWDKEDQSPQRMELGGASGPGMTTRAVMNFTGASYFILLGRPLGSSDNTQMWAEAWVCPNFWDCPRALCLLFVWI